MTRWVCVCWNQAHLARALQEILLPLAPRIVEAFCRFRWARKMTGRVPLALPRVGARLGDEAALPFCDGCDSSTTAETVVCLVHVSISDLLVPACFETCLGNANSEFHLLC